MIDKKHFAGIIDLIKDEFKDMPVLIEIVSKKVNDLLNDLLSLSKKEGYSISNIEELKYLIDKLFSNDLVSLRATSIHSNRKEFRAYNAYWEDPQLGKYFKKKNEKFLLLKGNGSIKRIFFCDSMCESVREDWFKDTVIDQIQKGASVKVIPISYDNIEIYSDYGIYDHKKNAKPIVQYILLAPRELNLNGELRTKLISKDSDYYSEQFEQMWNYCDETIELINDKLFKSINEANFFGKNSINDLFHKNIILRNMKLLATGENIIDIQQGFVRKYQYGYAEAVFRFINNKYQNISNIIYVGDTFDNDGCLIRNLQLMGIDTSGFICEPSIKLNNVWFNGIYYSSRWPDIIGYINKIKSSIDSDTLAIFDIDQTLWGAKGMHEKPLANARLAAIYRIIDSYVLSQKNKFASSIKTIAQNIYYEIKKVKYNNFTKDNEDYKAAITIYIALGIFANVNHSNISSKRLVEITSQDLLEWQLDEMIKKLLSKNHIINYVVDIMAETNSPHTEFWAKENGIKLDIVRNDIIILYKNIKSNSPAPYTKFRKYEFLETLNRAESNEIASIDKILCINKTTWDFAKLLNEKGVKLLALSDRPDEATYDEDKSLLDTPMVIYGTPIIDVIKGIF